MLVNMVAQTSDARAWLMQEGATRNGEEGAADTGNSLEDAVRDEAELPRQRLREQLGREPTEEEVKDWLRQHTEGY